MAEDNASRTNPLSMPWWLYLVLAVFSYLLLRYGPLLFTPSDGTMPPLATLAGQAAPIVAMLFLLLAAHGLYRDAPRQKGDDPEEDEE